MFPHWSCQCFMLSPDSTRQTDSGNATVTYLPTNAGQQPQQIQARSVLGYMVPDMKRLYCSSTWWFGFVQRERYTWRNVFPRRDSHVFAQQRLLARVRVAGGLPLGTMGFGHRVIERHPRVPRGQSYAERAESPQNLTTRRLWREPAMPFGDSSKGGSSQKTDARCTV